MITKKPLRDLTEKELKMESKIMADILNKRLRRLEQQGLQSSSVFYEYTTMYAQNGETFIDYTKQGKVKYITGFGKFNKKQMVRIYKAMKRAMIAKTSTVTGTKLSLKKKEQSLQKWFEDHDMQINVAVIDINEIFKTARITGFLNTYGSDTVMKMANAGKNAELVQERIEKINEVDKRMIKGQLPNAKVIKAMSMNDKQFNAWLDKEETKSLSRHLRTEIMSDEEKAFETLSRKTARQANALTKEENEIAKISKNLNKNLRGKKKK